MQKDPYSFSPIIDGQYHVTINLNELGMSSTEISKFKECYGEICREDKEFKEISSLDNYILIYRSESLFPLADNIDHKKKVMIVFGNPATNSIVKKMFFYSRQDGARHPVWKKLEDADLLSPKIRSLNTHVMPFGQPPRPRPIIPSDQILLSGLSTFVGMAYPNTIKRLIANTAKQ